MNSHVLNFIKHNDLLSLKYFINHFNGNMTVLMPVYISGLIVEKIQLDYVLNNKISLKKSKSSYCSVCLQCSGFYINHEVVPYTMSDKGTSVCNHCILRYTSKNKYNSG